jgi:hypothetical protein
MEEIIFDASRSIRTDERGVRMFLILVINWEMKRKEIRAD